MPIESVYEYNSSQQPDSRNQSLDDDAESQEHMRVSHNFPKRQKTGKLRVNVGQELKVLDMEPDD